MHITPAQTRPVQAYFARLRRSPAPQAREWASDIYFPSNEIGAFCPRQLQRQCLPAGGVYVGTGAGAFWGHALRVGAEHAYIVDRNRAVTHVVIPLVGLWLTLAETPAEWLSFCFGVPLNAADRDQLDSATPDLVEHYFRTRPADPQFSRAVADAAWAVLAPEIEAAERETAHSALAGFLRSFHAIHAPSRYGVHHFFLRGLSWPCAPFLASAALYTQARQLWLDARVTGIPADCMDPRTWEHLENERQGHHQSPFSALYLSNNLSFDLDWCSVLQVLRYGAPLRLPAHRQLASALATMCVADDAVVLTTLRGAQDGLVHTMPGFLHLLAGDARPIFLGAAARDWPVAPAASAAL